MYWDAAIKPEEYKSAQLNNKYTAYISRGALITAAALLIFSPFSGQAFLKGSIKIPWIMDTSNIMAMERALSAGTAYTSSGCIKMGSKGYNLQYTAMYIFNIL
jgi:hypothetical protein